MSKRPILTRVATLILTGLAFLLSTMDVSAYGPERATFTMAKPADYVTFNSITDNPVLGDERNFVRIAEDGAGVAYQDEITLEPGKTYELYIGYHNNAKSSLNQSGKGIARGAMVSVQYPTTVSPSKDETISSIISATNANPTEVWDSVTVKSNTDVVLNYVVGSAKIYNDWGTNGSVLSTDIFSEEGTYLGLNELNGLLPGCAEYSGHILIKFKANKTDASITKTASVDGTNFSKEVKARPGDEVTFKVDFINSGTTDLSNVTFHDEFPEGLELVPGTTTIKYSTESEPRALTDLIATNGYNTGVYGAGTGATLIYKARVTKEQDYCGRLVNKIFVDHNNGEKTDSATVVVEGEGCEPVPEDCTTNPDLPGCKKDCTTNPELPECQTIPDTGPVEIVLAIIIVLGLCGAGFYFWRTHKKVKAVENKVSGKSADKPEGKTTDKSADKTPENKSDKAEGTQIASSDEPKAKKPEDKTPEQK